MHFVSRLAAYDLAANAMPKLSRHPIQLQSVQPKRNNGTCQGEHPRLARY